MIIELSYQKNCRDLGGMKTIDGKYIKNKRLFRSGHLHRVSAKDIELLKSLNFTDIIDFRSEKEFIAKGNVVLEGVTYHNFPTLTIDGSSQEKGSSEDSNLLSFMGKEKNGFNYMKNLYAEIVTSEVGIKCYQDFFNVVQQENKVILFNCSQGKDRTGIAAYLLCYALGVVKSDLVEDYLFTNIAMKQKIRELTPYFLKQKGTNENMLPSLYDVFSAKKEYLDSALDAIITKYGSIDLYLENILKVDKEKLKKIYLD
ncbi:MAG: tyrosine-protein phosphatase [Bacilli bacterium]